MPKWAVYALPDRLKALKYDDIPTPRDIAVAIGSGRLPWIERDGLGRYFFNDTDVPKIATALGLKPPVKPDQPPGAAAVADIPSLAREFGRLFK